MEDDNHYFMVRCSAVGRRNDRTNRNIATSDRYLLVNFKREQRIDSAIASIRYQVVVSCGGYFGGGGV